MNYLKNSKPHEIKVIFIGLDNAGKSSIILTLLREISKITVVKATKGAQRRVYEFLGMNISEWDLGGHEKYRKTYIKTPDLFFERTDIAIYVIDIQDKQRVPKALNYLNEILNQFLLLRIDPVINIFFHKFDPDFSNDVLTELKILAQTIEHKIKKIPNFNKFFFHYTSIFNPSTIFNVMSKILLIKFPKSNIIEKTIKLFVKKLNVDSLAIIDNNSLIIGSYYKNDNIKKVLNSTLPYILAANEVLEETKLMEFHPEDHIIIHKFGNYFLFKKFFLKERKVPYYLICCKKELDFKNEFIFNLIKKFEDILYKS